ncbi:UNVERIFIED_CONTAM: Retrovirus-related Pol polyprotein from transposon TNT 1-94 [Sesamum latifolium]|uniref:Retrovirus-related Pol polyprotein from transposon TNT 1-94 n=1 Tax=Sesamum latifolium TaxID=2727402 RepID=A0AAW2XI44_9LAMI
MDVKTAFLNGELEEEVYMEQLEGFSSSNENIMDQCIYQKVSGSKTCFLVLYVDDILLATNDKSLRKISDERLFTSVAPIVKGDKLHLTQCPRNDLEREQMKDIPYASAIGSLMYAQVCTRPDIAFAVGIGKISERTENLEVVGYSDSDFAGCVDSTKSTSAEFVSCFEATSHGVWLKSFISGLKIMDSISRPLRIYSDNSPAVFMAKNNKSESRSKHIDIKYLAIRERVKEEKVVIEHISTKLMLADPLTKGMPLKNFKDHVARMGIGPMM